MLRSVFIFLKKNTFSFRGLAVIVAIPLIIMTSQLSGIMENWESELYTGYSLSVVQFGLVDRSMLLLFPVLCVLPGAASYLEDRKSGVYRAILSRTDRRSYVLGKSLACGLSGGFVVAAGILLSCLLSFAVFGSRSIGWDWKEMLPELKELGSLTGLYVLSGIFWSLFEMLLSLFTKSRYIACLSPFAAYYILQMLQQRYFKKVKLINPESWIVPFRYGFWEMDGAIAATVGGLCVFLLIILYHACRRDLKDA